MASKAKNTKSTETKQPRVKKDQAIGFAYGGVMKNKHAYLFSLDSYKDRASVEEYVRENLSQYLGSDLTGRYVRCVDASEALEKARELAGTKEYELDGSILTSEDP